jgi:hypothetical protein
MTIHFPDVSHYQAGLRLAGAAAVIAKATQGTGYRDPAYAGFKAQAIALGIPFAAYHWLDTTSAATQAKNCFGVVGPDVPLMIDDEQNIIDVGHTLAFVQAYRALGGRVVLEYAPRWVWERSGKPDLRPLAAAGLALVSSNYPTAGYTASGPGWATYGGVTPTIWQYTDVQPFGGQRVDFNAYRGTGDQLRALFNPLTIGADMAWDAKTTDNVAFTLLDGGEHQPVHVRLQALRADVAKLQAAVDTLATGGVDMDALATAVADKLAARLKD